jgi:excisionase family DNA binding protein
VLAELRASGLGRPRQELFTPDEAAELLRCKRQRVYELISARRLEAVKDGGRTLISRTALERYLGTLLTIVLALFALWLGLLALCVLGVDSAGHLLNALGVCPFDGRDM